MIRKKRGDVESGNGELGMWNWECGIGNVEKVSQQKGVSTEIEKKKHSLRIAPGVVI